jgi:hypothetical protein
MNASPAERLKTVIKAAPLLKTREFSGDDGVYVNPALSKSSPKKRPTRRGWKTGYDEEAELGGGHSAVPRINPKSTPVRWRGLSRLTDIALGAMVGTEIVGN